MANPQHNITFTTSLAQLSSVNVASTYGVIFGPLDLSLAQSICVEIQNPDNTQTIDCYVDVGSSQAGPFCTTAWQGLAAIGPNATRNDVFSKPAQSWIRLIAKADGAGITGAILSVKTLTSRLLQ